MRLDAHAWNRGRLGKGPGDTYYARSHVCGRKCDRPYVGRATRGSSLKSILNDGRQQGGKLIVRQGGSDPSLSVNTTIGFPARISKAFGAAAAASTRLYVAAGVNRRRGGLWADEVNL